MNSNPTMPISEMNPDRPASDYEVIFPDGSGSRAMQGFGHIDRAFFARHGHLPDSGSRGLRVRLRERSSA